MKGGINNFVYPFTNVVILTFSALGNYCFLFQLSIDRASAHVLETDRRAASVDMRHVWVVQWNNQTTRVNTLVANRPTRNFRLFATPVSVIVAQMRYTYQLHHLTHSLSQRDLSVYKNARAKILKLGK